MLTRRQRDFHSTSRVIRPLLPLKADAAAHYATGVISEGVWHLLKDGRELLLHVISAMVPNGKKRINTMRKSAVIFLFLLTSFTTAQKAPDFTAKDIGGKEIKLADYAGKTVLIDFWASWCVPCRKEMPFLIELYNDLKDRNFIILAVNVDDDLQKVDKFFRDIKMTPSFPVIFDQESNLPPLYELEKFPTSFLLDKNGIIKETFAGFTDEHKSKIRSAVEALLNEKQ